MTAGNVDEEGEVGSVEVEASGGGEVGGGPSTTIAFALDRMNPA